MLKELSYKNPEVLHQTLMDRYFSQPMPHITSEDIVVDEEQNNSGLTSQVYRIREGINPYNNKRIKILIDNKYLSLFCRNIAILTDLRNFSIQEEHAGKERSIPYAYSSGIFEGKPAFVETNMPHVKGYGMEAFLLSIGGGDTIKFIKDATGKLALFQMLGVIQRDAGFYNFGYNPETGNASMIDFGSAYTMDTASWSEPDCSETESVQLGIKTFSSDAMLVCRKTGLTTLEKLFTDIPHHPPTSFTNLLASVEDTLTTNNTL